MWRMWRLWNFAVQLVRLLFWGNKLRSTLPKLGAEALVVASAFGVGDRLWGTQRVLVWWGSLLMGPWGLLQVLGVGVAAVGVLVAVGAAWEQSTGVRLRLARPLERDHLGIFRLRVFNDGRKVTPEVALTRIVREDGSEPYTADLERELKWSHRPDGDRPVLGPDIERGLTVDAGGVPLVVAPPYSNLHVPTLCITAMNGAQLLIDPEIPPQERGRVWLEYTARGFGGSGGRASSWHCFTPELGDGVLMGYRHEDVPPPLPQRTLLLGGFRKQSIALPDAGIAVACYAQMARIPPHGKRCCLLVKNLSRTHAIEDCAATLRDFRGLFNGKPGDVLVAEHPLPWEDAQGKLHERVTIPPGKTATLAFAATGVDPSTPGDHHLCTLASLDGNGFSFGAGNPQHFSGRVCFEPTGRSVVPSSMAVDGTFIDNANPAEPSLLFLTKPPAPPQTPG